MAKLLESASKDKANLVVLQYELTEIQAAAKEKAKKKSKVRDQLQKGGVLAVKDGQQMVLDRQERDKKRKGRATKASQMATAVLGLLGD